MQKACIQSGKGRRWKGGKDEKVKRKKNAQTLNPNEKKMMERHITKHFRLMVKKRKDENDQRLKIITISEGAVDR